MSDPGCKLSIVCPAFQEEEVLPHFHAELCAALRSLEPSYDLEIVYVDDGSSDGTLPLLRRMAAVDPRIQYLSFSRNFGQQAALTAGLEHATGDAVITLDSDLQHPPSLIPALVEKWREGYDVVLTLRADDPRLSYFKRLSSRLFNWLMRSLSETPVSTGTSDYRLLSRSAIDSLQQMRETHRFLRGMVQWIGFPTTTVSFHPALRGAGTTKWTARRLAALATDAMLSFSKLPLRCSLFGGMLIVLLGILQGSGWVLRSLLGAPLLSWGQEALLLAVLLVGGSILCSVGVLGEYVGRIYEQVKGRPLYLLKETSPRLASGRAVAGRPHSGLSTQEAA